MYDELIKNLRGRSQFLLPHYGEETSYDSDLMKQAANAIEELICEVADEHNARLDAEETVVHCNNEENAKIIATLLNMDADGHYLSYSSIFGEEEEPAPPKEEKIS